MLKKELIHLNMDCKSSQEAMRILAQSFVDNAVVKESFIAAVIEREEHYPTGLPAKAFDIAIPHTVSEHVLEPSIAIGVLSHPVEFRQMGSPEIVLHPQLLFMLAITAPKEQITLLKRIMKLLQNEELLCAIRNAKSADRIIELLAPELEP